MGRCDGRGWGRPGGGPPGGRAGGGEEEDAEMEADGHGLARGDDDKTAPAHCTAQRAVGGARTRPSSCLPVGPRDAPAPSTHHFIHINDGGRVRGAGCTGGGPLHRTGGWRERGEGQTGRDGGLACMACA